VSGLVGRVRDSPGLWIATCRLLASDVAAASVSPVPQVGHSDPQSVSSFREAMSWAQILVSANPYCTCSSNTMSLRVSCWPSMSDELSGVQLTPRMRGPYGRSTSFRNGFVASGSTIQTDAAAFEF